MISLRLKALAVTLLFLTFALTEFDQHQAWAGVGLLSIALIFAVFVIKRRTRH
jgi:uncharacterized membrane protein YbaN (DUF454 family)